MILAHPLELDLSEPDSEAQEPSLTNLTLSEPSKSKPQKYNIQKVQENNKKHNPNVGKASDNTNIPNSEDKPASTKTTASKSIDPAGAVPAPDSAPEKQAPKNEANQISKQLPLQPDGSETRLQVPSEKIDVKPPKSKSDKISVDPIRDIVQNKGSADIEGMAMIKNVCGRILKCPRF